MLNAMYTERLSSRLESDEWVNVVITVEVDPDTSLDARIFLIQNFARRAKMNLTYGGTLWIIYRDNQIFIHNVHRGNLWGISQIDSIRQMDLDAPA